MNKNELSNIKIRVAKVSDAARIVEIFSYYVKNTAITFYTDVPTIDSYKEKIKRILKCYPFYVACVDDNIIAYAYADRFRPHNAYDWDVELSVYTDANYVSKGIGSVIYTKLIDTLKKQGIRNVYGAITYPNPKSEALHKKLGFKKVGLFPNCGNKFGDWQDVVWYSKAINNFTSNPDKPVNFPNLA